MSYILDALRRADLERDRGAVPGLHTQGLPPLTGEDPATPRVSFWGWGLGALAALVLASLVWVLVKKPATAPRISAAPATAAEPTSARPTPLPASSALVAPPHAPPTQPAPPEIVVVTVPTPANVAPRSPAVAAATPPALDVPREAPAALAKAIAAKPAAAPPGTAGDAAAAPPHVYALHELPPEVRRAIPPLVVNGSVYSKNPADRFLIINGQIVHEAGSVAPDITLETIGPRAAVLSTLGHRFEISY